MLTKKTFKLLKQSFMVAFLSLFTTVVVNAQSDQNMNTGKVMVTEENVEYEISDWDARVTYNPFLYSYMLWHRPIVEKVKIKKVYPVAMTEFDQPPVFSKACVEASDPVACSNEEFQEFVNNKNFEYPVEAQRNKQEGIEYVSFVLTKKGEFEGRPSILKKENPCEGCANQAIDIVMQTEGKWQPAILDGEAVDVQITVPVRFDLKYLDLK